MTRPPRPGWAARVADVTRSADQARVTYDRLARWYDLIEAPFERRARAAGLRLLDARQSEHILEIGFGTGHTLAALQRQVGTTGLLVGIDLALRMAQRTRRRLGTPATHLTVAVLQGDARHLPLHNASFDAVTLAFTLDLISTDAGPALPTAARCRSATCSPAAGTHQYGVGHRPSPASPSARSRLPADRPDLPPPGRGRGAG